MSAKGNPSGGQPNELRHPGGAASSVMPKCAAHLGKRQVVRAAGRVVGEMRGDLFVKRVCPAKHMLKIPRGWALDVGSLKDAEHLGARHVETHDVETDEVYTAPIALIRAQGFTVDRGHALQIAPPLERWSCESPGPLSQLLPFWVMMTASILVIIIRSTWQLLTDAGCSDAEIEAMSRSEVWERLGGMPETPRTLDPKPTIAGQQYQMRKPNGAGLTAWFGNSTAHTLATATGAVSGVASVTENARMAVTSVVAFVSVTLTLLYRSRRSDGDGRLQGDHNGEP